MNKIDKFLEMMVQRKADKAILISGKPYQVWVEGKKTEGGVLSFEQLRQILLEIAPPSQHAQATQGGAFHFSYPSPYGTFDIGAETFFESIQLTIAPARAVEVAPQSMPLQPVAVQPIVHQTANFPAAMQIFCQRCGMANANGATFCSGCGQPLNLSTPTMPSNVVYPQATQSNMPMQNIVNVSVEQKSSSAGWWAALLLLLFGTPLGCIMIPVAVLALMSVLAIGLSFAPAILGGVAAIIVWNNKAIPQDKKMPVIGGILLVATIIQLAIFFIPTANVPQAVVSPTPMPF